MPLSLRFYFNLERHSTWEEESLLRDYSHFNLASLSANEMSELNSTEHVSEDLIAPDAGTQEHAVDSTSELWETGGPPSLPSIDSQRSTVSFKAMLVSLMLTQIPCRATLILLLVPSLIRSFPVLVFV
jgi:hypothetical protein